MKKITFVAIMIMAVISAKAQLKVDSVGKVIVGSTSPNGTLTIPVGVRLSVEDGSLQ